MPRLATTLLVEMDGGATHQVVADQRDYARVEAADIPEGMHTSVRHLAWTAMTRAGLTKSTFQRFNEVDCVEVTAPDEEAKEGEQGLDPGRPTP